VAATGLFSDSSLLPCTLLVLLLPLLSFVLSLFTSERYSWLVSLNALMILLITCILSIYLLLTGWNTGSIIFAMEWFTIGTTKLSASIVLTNTSLVMLAVVSLISFLVHVYSAGYMAGDPGIKKYFAMLGFFTFSMQGIVLADNLLLLFISWELVGFSSYVLIGHWMEKPEAARAAHKAFLINRIGDAGFLVGLMIIWTHTNSFNLSEILHTQSLQSWQTAASLCIFCGVMGKSAQFPLFTWLPDAMEGPTPVSALIHAATMVAAGVYMTVRVFPLFTPVTLNVVAVTGMTTAIIGALSALYQHDIKKVLAYSTLSQLGLMIMALGMGAVNAALLHLFAHAFFKACLFLSAGSVIHALHHAQAGLQEPFDAQDIRTMGGLRKKLPITFLTFLMSGASLAGIPFFSGFLSKEAIFTAVWLNSGFISWLMLVTIASVSFLTVIYTFRLIWLVFMGKERHTLSERIIESPIVMRVPLVLLAALSLWLVVSGNPFDFTGWLMPAGHHAPIGWITAFSVIWIGLALLTSYYLFRTPTFYTNTYLQNGFYIDLITRKFFVSLTLKGAAFTHFIDKKWIDGAIHGSAYAHVTLSHVTGWLDKAVLDGIVNGIATLSRWLGSMTRSFQGGKIQLYIFWSVLAIIIFLIWNFK
jgi:NADH-quinone oxidoreductase subunit L